MIIDVTDPKTGERFIYIDDHDADVCDNPSLTSYMLGRCRCSRCREVNRAYQHRRRAWPICEACGQRIRNSA